MQFSKIKNTVPINGIKLISYIIYYTETEEQLTQQYSTSWNIISYTLETIENLNSVKID